MREMRDMRYVAGVPRKVPEGRIVVHNHVRLAAEIGVGGFRVWTEPVGAPARVMCGCSWAPHLAEHYHVDSEGEE